MRKQFAVAWPECVIQDQLPQQCHISLLCQARRLPAAAAIKMSRSKPGTRRPGIEMRVGGECVLTDRAARQPSLLCRGSMRCNTGEQHLPGEANRAEAQPRTDSAVYWRVIVRMPTPRTATGNCDSQKVPRWAAVNARMRRTTARGPFDVCIRFCDHRWHSTIELLARTSIFRPEPPTFVQLGELRQFQSE